VLSAVLFFALSALFMAWKQAVAFTFASELHVPDCIFCAGLALRNASLALPPFGASPGHGRLRISVQSNGYRKAR